MKTVPELPDYFMNIHPDYIPQSLSTEEDTNAMNPQRPDINHKPSCSKSQSVWRGGALNVISARDVI